MLSPANTKELSCMQSMRCKPCHVCKEASLLCVMLQGWHAPCSWSPEPATGTSIDLPAEGDLPTAHQLMAIVAGSGEYAVAWRHGHMLALRLVPAGIPTPRHAGLKPPPHHRHLQAVQRCGSLTVSAVPTYTLQQLASDRSIVAQRSDTLAVSPVQHADWKKSTHHRSIQTGRWSMTCDMHTGTGSVAC